MSENKPSLLSIIKQREMNTFDLEKMRVTPEDAPELATALLGYYALRQKHDKSVTGRVESAKTLKEDASAIVAFMHILTNNLQSDIRGYDNELNEQYPIVTDFNLAMNVILRLANSKGEKYTKKEFSTWHNSLGEELRTTIIIGDKSVLENEESTMLPISYLGKLTSELVSTRNSLIITTQNSVDNCVIPSRNDTPEVVEYTINCSSPQDWPNSLLSCFLFEDELRNATEKFLRFIKKNGPDIKGMNEDELFKTINEEPDVIGVKRKEVTF